MSLYLTSKITSMNLSGYLDSFTNSYNKTIEQLSSGNKNNSAADNPIAVTTTSKNKVIISGNEQALANINLGQDLLSLSGDTLSTVTSNLQRIRDLCMQAANETYSSTDKDAILTEIKQRLNQIDKTADSTEFNNIKLFDGSVKSFNIQTGTNSDSSVDIGKVFTDLHVSQLGGDIRLGDDVTGKTWTTDDIEAYVNKLDNALQGLNNTSAEGGSFSNRLDKASAMLTNINTGLTEKNSLLSDTDTAAASAALVRYQILQQASASLLVQANQIPEYAVQLLQNV